MRTHNGETGPLAFDSTSLRVIQLPPTPPRNGEGDAQDLDSFRGGSAGDSLETAANCRRYLSNHALKTGEYCRVSWRRGGPDEPAPV
jgi:hypothetical protein